MQPIFKLQVFTRFFSKKDEENGFQLIFQTSKYLDLDLDPIQYTYFYKKELHKSMEKNPLLQFSTFLKFGFFDSIWCTS